MTRQPSPARDTLHDALGRPLRSLRISVTDRCNLRCRYCMPEDEYDWIPRDELLTFEEIAGLVDVFTRLGVDRVRLTGGEPLLRRDLHALVAALARKPLIRDLALTTNALLLADQADALRRAGLHRVTISLDTLRPQRYRRLSGADGLDRALAGVDAARRAGLPIKLNACVLRGVNDDEPPDLIEFARAIGAEVRFIEYMDVGGATLWNAADVVPRNEILAHLAARFGPIREFMAQDDDAPAATPNRAPAERFTLPDGTRFGVIASTTAPFCRACDRARLTADGAFYLCLYAYAGIDLKSLLRRGGGALEIEERLRSAWAARRDRGAETRAAVVHRGPFVSLADLRRDRRLEMHVRGG